MKPLQINGLQLTIEDKTILHQINLAVDAGETLALLGPNGAGKSSLIDVVTQSLKPTQGNVQVLGKTFQQTKSRIGVLYEHVSYFPFWKVQEIIRYVACIQGVAMADLKEVMQALDISRTQDKFIKSLSKGERKKVSILIAILHDPSFLILDEPTADLDPFSREVCWRWFKRNHRSLLFTTHQWEEAERYADRIAFIHDGRITAVDTPQRLLSPAYIHANKKVILAKMPEMLPVLSDYEFTEDEAHYYVFVQEVNPFLRLIQPFTYNYSILDKDLKDVYWYLKSKPQRHESIHPNLDTRYVPTAS